MLPPEDDLNLPTVVKQGEPTDEDKKVTQEILEAFEAGKNITVIVLGACGEEKIISPVKVTDA